MRTYKQIVGEVKARWGGWRAVDVDADELEDYRDELAENGLAASTLNQRRAVLSGIFKVARRRFRVNVDPLDGFERAETKDAGDLEVYSIEEVWALIRTVYSGAHHAPPKRRLTDVELAARRVQDSLDAAIILVAALCWLRRSEILGLRWRAVLLEQRAIVVRRGFTNVGGDRLPIAGGASVHDVQKWMGHRHLATTMRYVHYQPQLDAAELLGKRFQGTAGELATLLGDPSSVTIPGDLTAPETAS